MKGIREATNDFQEVKLLVDRAPEVICKVLDSEDLTCDKCIDEINWKSCKHFGARVWFEKDGRKKKNKNMLEEMYVSQLSEFRQTVIAPMLANYVTKTPNLQTDDQVRIFLTCAPTHICFKLPNDENFMVKKGDLKFYENNQHIEINCIPIMPFRSHSVTNVYETKKHFMKCLALIFENFQNKRLEIHTYLGSSNINVRCYLQALMEFDVTHDQETSNWTYYDYFHTINISDDETVFERDVEKRLEKNSGYHLLPSLPHSFKFPDSLKEKKTYRKMLEEKGLEISNLQSKLSEKESEISSLQSKAAKILEEE